MTPALSADAVAALTAATAHPDRVTLAPGQLDRKVYTEVDRALSRLGGKWNRRERAHLFPTDPRPALADLLDTGAMPVDQVKAMAYWRTPDGLADQVVARLHLPPCASVLEPSAGDGSLVAAIHRRYPHAVVTAVEPDRGRFDQVSLLAAVAFQTTLEDYAATQAGDFDAVVMNPPFSAAGAPTLYADHITLAWSLLRRGGRLAAIAPSGLLASRVRKVVALRERIEAAGGAVHPLPPGSFREAGTGANTVLVDVPAVTR